MDGYAPRLAFRLDEQQRFLAEHEHGSAAKKVRGDHRRTGRDRVRAVDDGDGIAAGIGHCSSPLPACGERIHHATQPSKPCRICSSGRLRPMKMMRLSRFSSLFQGR